MRRLGLIGLSLMCATPAWADNITGDKVVLRTLDKVTASTQDYTVKVGDTLTYGTLTVDVKHCEKKPPEDIPETFAFLQIFDHKTDVLADIIEANDKTSSVGEAKPSDTMEREPDSDEPLKLFSGWMLASKPAISALDHPVYDIWVIDCLPAAGL